MADEILTAEELSKYLKIPKPTLYYLARTGRIPALKVGRHWRFEEQEIKSWIKEQGARNKNKGEGGRK